MKKSQNKYKNNRSAVRRAGGSMLSTANTGLVELTDRDSYSGLQKDVMLLPGVPVLLTSTVTTGVIASSIALDASTVGDFSTRVAPLWDEYRTLGVNVKIRPVAASAATGISVFMFNEKSNNNPTLVDAQQRVGLRLPNCGANSGAVRTMRFRTSDLFDLQYTSTASSATVAYFKTYTDNANFGSSIVATATWLIEPEYIVEVRGIKGS